ncbi:hypothetical protein ADUPG1_006250, partial [Aduncisulcus paluster]
MTIFPFDHVIIVTGINFIPTSSLQSIVQLCIRQRVSPKNKIPHGKSYFEYDTSGCRFSIDPNHIPKRWLDYIRIRVAKNLCASLNAVKALNKPLISSFPPSVFLNPIRSLVSTIFLNKLIPDEIHEMVTGVINDTYSKYPKYGPLDEEGKANDEKRRKVAILGGRRRIKKNRKSVGGREVKKSDDDVELPEYLLDDLLLA